MGEWWSRDIVDAGKLPLLLALVAFLVTFLVTRTVTRLIRAGHGPFRNVESAGGVHIHHVVPGVVLMMVGGFGAMTTAREQEIAPVLAVLFGVGAGLVLDEFALIVYLSDVYWTENGRKSVEAVVLTAALLGLLLLGYAPFGTEELTQEQRENRAELFSVVGVNVLCAAVALVKGRFVLAVLGVLVPFLALFAALRLARPESPWARRVYRRRPRALERARRRAARHDARWGALTRRLQNALGGRPSA
ncbi:hypothetical protein GCM10023347_41560 [Streptomyces chumphonensis]|uniref:Integral membrane protein n=1 Tax=Streptomyces chumphonensis TaxID=1214925 RepID=A0A927IAW9_9ACTN|nr:hypothetical protein [Streptomyces chumphonensis]MBD3930332.1 hypothetical protein [Streptomyces chumphonensis]